MINPVWSSKTLVSWMMAKSPSALPGTARKNKRRPVSDSSEEALKDTTAVWRQSGEDYLLYSTRSGFHMSVDGTLIFLIPP